MTADVRKGFLGVPDPADRSGPRSGVDSEIMDRNISDPGKVTRQVRVPNKMGLHARPAMQFVDLANTFVSKIRVSKAQQWVNAKSIMELLLLAAGEGTILTIQAQGQDAEKAVQALIELVETGFEEE